MSWWRDGGSTKGVLYILSCWGRCPEPRTTRTSKGRIYCTFCLRLNISTPSGIIFPVQSQVRKIMPHFCIATSEPQVIQDPARGRLHIVHRARDLHHSLVAPWGIADIRVYITPPDRLMFSNSWPETPWTVATSLVYKNNLICFFPSLAKASAVGPLYLQGRRPYQS